jgi:RimJ/RimL family protein N-acetyltransferase
LRIDLREFTRDDFDDLLRLDSDPRVTKYINGGKPMSTKEVEPRSVA